MAVKHWMRKIGRKCWKVRCCGWKKTDCAGAGAGSYTLNHARSGWVNLQLATQRLVVQLSPTLVSRSITLNLAIPVLIAFREVDEFS